MAYKLEVKQEAKQDIINGFLWYEEKSTGLGIKFFLEVEEIIEYIQIYPMHYQIRKSVFREAVLKVFPYVVIYEISIDKIIVYSVFPTRNDPKKKVK